MKKTIVLVFLLFTSFSLLAQENFSSVEERMTGKEFMETGLNKLTDQELQALNKWLRDHSVATLENRSASSRRIESGSNTATATASTAAAASDDAGDNRGFENVQTSRDKIHSRLIGEFSGWNNGTVFKLENGMIWKQEQTDHYSTKTLTNPEVTIKPGMFGSWRLSVDGYNKWVEVIRIQ